MMEDKLKSNLISAISRDFEILPEVPGRILLTQDAVRIDFLAFPRQHLIEQGFAYGWFGIEVKHFLDFNKQGLGKKSKLIWQAINYSQSEFFVKQDLIKPDFIALYIGDSFSGNGNEQGARDWFVLMNLAGYANIFEFHIKDFMNWELWGPGGWLYTRLRGPRNRIISKKKRNWS